MQAISGGLGVNGTMIVIGAVGALTVNSLDLIAKRASAKGWYSGTAADSEDTPYSVCSTVSKAAKAPAPECLQLPWCPHAEAGTQEFRQRNNFRVGEL